MSNTQPGAASTPPIRSAVARTGFGHHPLYGYMGFIEGFIKAQASAAVLRKEFDRMSNTPLRSMAKATLKEAIWDGWYRLHREAEERAKEALDRGQILLCWHGTRSLEVSA